MTREWRKRVDREGGERKRRGRGREEQRKGGGNRGSKIECREMERSVWTVGCA